MIARVKKSCDQLLEEATAKEEAFRSHLRAEKTSAQADLENLQAILSRAARASVSDGDVMVVRKELKGALLSQERLDQHSQRAHRQGEGWGWKYDVTDDLRLDDVQTYMGRVVKGEGSDVARPMTMRELTENVQQVLEATASVTSQLTTCNQDVTSLTRRQADLEKTSSSLSSDVASWKKTESELKKTTSSLKTDVASLKKTESEAKKTTSSLKTDVASLKKTESELTKMTSSLKTEVESMKTGGTESESKTVVPKTVCGKS